MKTIATYRLPVRIYTARDLAAMPLSTMQQCLDAQEKHAARMSSLSTDGRSLLDTLQGGAPLLAVHDKADRRHWSIGGSHVPASTVNQLDRRGLLDMRTE